MRTTLCALAVLPALFLAPCADKGGGRATSKPPPAVETQDQRCHRLVPRVELEAAERGYRLDCTPTPSRPANGATGWHDAGTRTLWVWADAIGDDRQVVLVSWHELGHAIYGPDEETAERVSFCNAPQVGISYRLTRFPTPTECAAWVIP